MWFAACDGWYALEMMYPRDEVECAGSMIVISLLEDIHKALDAEAYYIALMGALTLPDICGSMDHADGRASKARYIEWFNRWAGHKYTAFLDGEQCYGFRCDMLHQGTTGTPARTYSRIVFIVPGYEGISAHRAIANDWLVLDLPVFCNDLTSAVYSWLHHVTGTEPATSHLARIVQTYPNGISGRFINIPVIA